MEKNNTIEEKNKKSLSLSGKNIKPRSKLTTVGITIGIVLVLLVLGYWVLGVVSKNNKYTQALGALKENDVLIVRYAEESLDALDKEDYSTMQEKTKLTAEKYGVCVIKAENLKKLTEEQNRSEKLVNRWEKLAVRCEAGDKYYAKLDEWALAKQEGNESKATTLKQESDELNNELEKAIEEYKEAK